MELEMTCNFLEVSPLLRGRIDKGDLFTYQLRLRGADGVELGFIENIAKFFALRALTVLAKTKLFYFEKPPSIYQSLEKIQERMANDHERLFGDFVVSEDDEHFHFVLHWLTKDVAPSYSRIPLEHILRQMFTVSKMNIKKQELSSLVFEEVDTTKEHEPLKPPIKEVHLVKKDGVLMPLPLVLLGQVLYYSTYVDGNIAFHLFGESKSYVPLLTKAYGRDVTENMTNLKRLSQTMKMIELAFKSVPPTLSKEAGFEKVFLTLSDYEEATFECLSYERPREFRGDPLTIMDRGGNPTPEVLKKVEKLSKTFFFDPNGFYCHYDSKTKLGYIGLSAEEQARRDRVIENTANSGLSSGRYYKIFYEIEKELLKN